MTSAATAPRVRFAPSPTGYLHLGGARTALFNWLWARKHGGQFILRVEDTDRERSTQESVQAIFESMLWLGLNWDEGPTVTAPDGTTVGGGDNGPYFQTERIDTYKRVADELIAKRLAYRCYCTKEDLDVARKAHAATGVKDAFRYPGTCRDRKDEPDRQHVVRFRAPETGVTGWDDLVKGRIEVPNSAQQDFVLVRGNGIPLYNFGAVVDDLTMNVTLVARGDDHVVNTPPQLMMYQALGANVPQLAHLPMIQAPNGEKLSKRHAAVAVLDYRDNGYLPDGVLNYLARLGWSHGDQEIFSRAELVDLFGWEHVGSTAGKYDVKKFSHVQASHLRMLSDAELGVQALPFLAKRGLNVTADDARLTPTMALVKPRATTFTEVADAADYIFRDELVFDEAARTKLLIKDAVPALTGLIDILKQADAFVAVPMEESVKAWSEASGIALKDIAQPARVALTGRKASPGLFDVMQILGREVTLSRLEAGLAFCQSAAT